MLTVHPIGRLAAALLIMASAFVVRQPESLLVVYCLVFAGVVGARLVRQHSRFVIIITLPLLAILLILWGLIASPPAAEHMTGVRYALAAWLRIVVLGSTFQWLLLPLAERPLHFRAFLAALRLPGSVGTLLITPILFLPEIRRRMERIVDARKAQGLPAMGFAGLLALPGIMTPLVSSLLESSLARSELWTHRRLLDRDPSAWSQMNYDRILSLCVTLVAAVILVAGLVSWI